jgi:adenine-specific DNA-methyltransferase
LEAFATLDDEQPLKVHFRIIDASESEHGNIKVTSDQKRFFLIHEEAPIAMENGELVIQFHYRTDAEKTGQDSKWQEKLLEQAELAILNALKENPSSSGFLQGLSRLAPTDSKTKRTLLGKYLYKYAARNTMDYFIHKDLGGFMRRELDFYIKNEIMRLDDIENADASKVEQYLAQIRVLRGIAHQLIAFLSQLEDFQKKLWLKKKFVTETNYCITLDRVPEKLYAEIAANDSQHDEWLRLFAIDEIELSTEMAVTYSRPLSVDFLILNNKLVIDTRFFDENFKARLISSVENFEEQCDGLLIHSENFQALSEMHIISRETIKCIYIDPPYNTGQDEFLYKDSYQSSSWLCMLADRLALAKGFLKQDGAIAVSIDENEVSALLRLMDDIFGKENRAGIAIIKRGSVTGHKAINKGLVNITEYLIIYALNKSKWDPKRAYKPRERNERYNNFIKNYSDSPEKWQICSLLDAFAEYKGMPKNKLKKTLGKTYEDEIFSFIKLNAESVIQLAYPDEANVSKDAQEAIKESRKNKSSVLHFKRGGVPDMFLIGGQRLLFYKDRLVEMDGELVTAEPLSDIWDDILPNDLHNEGGVSLKKGKKPEKLLNRIYDICCDERETVLDFFLGSGTTAATALKRGLKFVGVEQSEYFDSKAIERIKLVNKTKKKHEEEQSFLIKYLRLESYEDTLNNLVLKADSRAVKSKACKPSI